MAILVLLSFEDDEEAKDFVRAANDGDVQSAQVVWDGQVVAAYKQPTMFHEPFETHGRGKTGEGWTMGQKWGWWVCNVCKKPSRMYWESELNKQSSFGKNILHLLLPKKEEADV